MHLLRILWSFCAISDISDIDLSIEHIAGVNNCAAICLISYCCTHRYRNSLPQSQHPFNRSWVQTGHCLPLENCSGLLSMRCGRVHQEYLYYWPASLHNILFKHSEMPYTYHWINIAIVCISPGDHRPLLLNYQGLPGGSMLFAHHLWQAQRVLRPAYSSSSTGPERHKEDTISTAGAQSLATYNIGYYERDKISHLNSLWLVLPQDDMGSLLSGIFWILKVQWVYSSATGKLRQGC